MECGLRSFNYVRYVSASLPEQVTGQDAVTGTVDFGIETEGEVRSSIVNLRLKAKEHSVSLVG